MKCIGEVFHDRRRVYLDRRNEFYHNNNDTCDIVLIGDSITENFNIALAGATSKSILNSGISGDRLKNIHYRLNTDAIGLKPKQILLMAGINDLLSDKPNTPDNYIENIEKLFNYYKDIVETISDCGIEPLCCGLIKINQFEHNHMFKNQQIEYFNSLLLEYAKKRKYKFIDYNIVLSSNYGGIDTTYFSDGLHPNDKGYFEMYKYLKKLEII